MVVAVLAVAVAPVVGVAADRLVMGEYFTTYG